MSLIFISGAARAGKNTFADILKDALEGDYTLIAYADELKKKCMEDFNLSYEQVHGKYKEIPDKRYRKEIIDDEVVYWTPREIMQFIGTDCYRMIDNNFWVKSLFKRVDKLGLRNVICTDCRFPNEISIPKDRGGYHIRVERENTPKIHGTNHLSETALDGCVDIDFIVNNNKTIPDLYLEANRFIKSCLLK